MPTLNALIDAKRTLIVVGPGGVGKTTTSAAFAVHAARSGKKVLVLTVDPAKRLANSLGLKALDNEEVQIDPALFEAAGLAVAPGGELWGMMLDTKSTFDSLIETYAPNDAVRFQIYSNPFYKQASGALAGSQEYMAMEKLYELREGGRYDLIVLDTPPTTNALDFLSAADRLEDFLGSSSTRLLLKSMKAAGRVGLGFLKANAFVMRGLNKFVGADTFIGLLEFIQAFHDMYAGFKSRAGRVKAILRSDDVGFVIVTSTEQATIDEGLYFHQLLRESEMPFGAMIVNRVRPSRMGTTDLADIERGLIQGSSADEASATEAIRAALRAAGDYEIMAAVDALRVEALIASLRADEETEAATGEDAGEETGDIAVYPVPLFDRDIHDIEGLSRFAELAVQTRAGG